VLSIYYISSSIPHTQYKLASGAVFLLNFDGTRPIIIERTFLFEIAEAVFLQRTILHSDMNSFYASVECLYHPELRDKPVIVCGDPELRHGIVLAKNDLAKSAGVITGEAIFQARNKCPGLVAVQADFPVYLRFARAVREIYADYTDQIEPFGLDEAWLDVTGSGIIGNGRSIADDIRRRVRGELGITASVGVSFNKIFAKLGSDIKKPDATTLISRENFKETIWPLPARELLYIGPSTWGKLKRISLNTIGKVAQSDPLFLRSFLGKWGEVLWSFANGQDYSPVARSGESADIKSVGHSTTTPRDLVSETDVRMTFYILAEAVAARMREMGFLCRTVQIFIRDRQLQSFERQHRLDEPTCLASVMTRVAMELFRANYTWGMGIRCVGIRGADLVTAEGYRQLSIWDRENRRQESLERTVEDLRRRYGHFVVQRGLMLKDTRLSDLAPKEDHVIFPVSFFR
jgi:DNA polymerase IV